MKILRMTGTKLFSKWPNVNIMSSASIYRTKTPTPEEYELLQEKCVEQNNNIIQKFSESRISSKVNSANVKSFIQNQNIPRKTKRTIYSFVADVSVAERMGQLILKNLRSTTDLVIENNPGLGLLTWVLSESEIKNIKVIQPKTKNNAFLSQIIAKNDSKIEAQNGDIFQPRPAESLFYTNLIDTGTKATIVGVVQHPSFFTNIVRILARDFLWKRINFEFILAVSEHVYHNLTDFTKATGKFNVYCLFNYFFTVKEITRFPRTAFIPLSFENEENMHLIKVTRNPKSLNVLNDEDFTHYTMFLRIMERSRYAFVIKSLEKWFPDCGLQLIREGLNCTNRTCDLTAKESIALFKILRNCEGFATFKTLLPLFESGRPYLQHPDTDDSAKSQLNT